MIIRLFKTFITKLRKEYDQTTGKMKFTYSMTSKEKRNICMKEFCDYLSNDFYKQLFFLLQHRVAYGRINFQPEGCLAIAK